VHKAILVHKVIQVLLEDLLVLLAKEVLLALMVLLAKEVLLALMVQLVQLVQLAKEV
jgi:hypothetical protein